mmetsp:Transcript_75269/g.197265  ORF Transcript_75269/g.197265 Transcript_75269/m.197265 type:complete len:480 (+) Transcript_75269:56-1495(+)
MPAAVQPFVIGIAGGTASGKSTVCRRITQCLGGERVVLLSLDEFYRDLTKEECENIGDVNFDEPEAFDIASLAACIDTLLASEPADVPVYDFVTSRRCPVRRRRVNPADVVVVEGILALHCPEILSRCDMKVFVDTDDDTRLARRIRRDTVERGRDVGGVLAQYVRFVKPSFNKYVLPSKRNADIIVPWRDKDNAVAVDLITQHIRGKLSKNDLGRIFPGLHIMPSTVQTRAMITKIKNVDTSREEFVFFADRLIRLVVEAALAQLPFSEGPVTTPSGDQYPGVHFSPSELCGVSLIRSGETMETALRQCCAGIRIGKMLVDPSCGDLSSSAGSPSAAAGSQASYMKLPEDIAQRRVLLMDPILSGASRLLLAIELLVKNREVPEEKIFLVTLVATRSGIQEVFARFPAVQVIVVEIDEKAGEDKAGKSSLGEFGDRYFGTTDLDDFVCVQLSPRAGSSDSTAAPFGSEVISSGEDSQS